MRRSVVLPAAGRTEQGNKFAGGDVEVDGFFSASETACKCLFKF